MNLCLPTLQIIPLLLARLVYRNTKITAHYGGWPLYLRVASRYLKFNTQTIDGFLARLTGIEIRKIDLVWESAAPSSYSAKDVELITRIAEKLIGPAGSDTWVTLLKQLAGDEPATAYAIKYAAHYEIYLQLSYAISFAYMNPGGETTIVWKPSWPAEWLKLVSDAVIEYRISLFDWPAWYVKLHSLGCRLSLPFRLIGITFARVIARGITLRRIERKPFKLMAEFIEPERLGGSPYDADFCVDEKHLGKSDVLFFLTKLQRRILQSEGHPVPEVLRKVRSRGYELVSLEELPYPAAILSTAIRTTLEVVRASASARSVTLSTMFLSAWAHYLEYAGLFAHYSAAAFLHSTHPPGNTGWRIEGPIIASFCRRSGIRMVGTQTTLLHFKLHEFCFECYDVFLTWGTGWTTVLGNGMKFVKSEQVVGCHYLDALFPEFKRGNRKKGRVLVFTGDIGSAHYPFSRTLSFLEACCELALLHPDSEFLIKTKNAADAEHVLSNARFREAFERARHNCRFLQLPRHEYVEYLTSAELVIAMGYTTPGTEALLLGIPTIYYDGFQGAGTPFRAFEGLIVSGREEMQQRFADRKTWDIGALDPFRDGRAKDRINSALQV